ncbi:MAG: 2-C-methyl-D-erythritol 2,4-cyclodiphosphate synthase [Verrucomicrobiota bacterium]|jgi:2-C-methyl-D-erythritol 2,4-cyclodiphosphate synthase|nr:2-C-methyl-D-erythritol 2,4-cyclodiphosphate synthase [Verrucomicrobiales bacterium]MEC9037735.1 2-C-methyl-D-erythritol 2,4-cyclodiphosphate synthase [Verrucomicrobiota bacterium]MCH2024296.1 2-C-methyl-D-erythritol 2,4-cyclodiphosphate synthase [Verrucomicrobiales bacterium]MED5471251.1 2-C-methyl-D-erythritol 2,4-cyclodiphosphate synthase [Verrucomicrobiota bacterium]MEE2966387.1 2-C-methyl-D-erythritol 2,4-cyclodiphosphate synthase [Verrucomicrobiota bacterium]|tara:strand:- start:925 stop:1401 length:477 start_codon:yes stop_codon:yes gene_type:complete
MAARSGIGYDVHRLVEGRPLILGGVNIPWQKGLDGHSDADVLSHAIADAILGAVGAPDIGYFFPPSDNSIKGISSMSILQKTAQEVADRGGEIINVDSSLIAEEPKILAHADEMKKNISQALGLDVVKIGIKATTNERMGFVGKGEGMAAMAIASVEI